MTAGIAFGSNLGDRFALLQAARNRLTKLPGVEPALVCSSVYETMPIACEPEAPRFLNAVMEIGCEGSAHDLLRELRQIEEELGRPKAHPRNASRTIDLDLLYFGDEAIDEAELKLPHPRLAERRFVLEPLAEIRCDLILPGQTETVASLLQKLPPPPLVRFASEW